jgi:hypothetical protein
VPKNKKGKTQMAVKLIANYSKRLGLPGFSSHQFSVSVETELMNVDDVAGESERLYTLLQSSVDQQIQTTGFVPPDGYGMEPVTSRSNGNGNGHRSNGTNGNGDHWQCTDGQRSFLQRIVNEHQLDKNQVEQQAQQLFGAGVKELNKLQMSQLIEELLEQTGKQGGRRRWSRPQTTRK